VSERRLARSTVTLSGRADSSMRPYALVTDRAGKDAFGAITL
jgi:hypothetical protein